MPYQFKVPNGNLKGTEVGIRLRCCLAANHDPDFERSRLCDFFAQHRGFDSEAKNTKKLIDVCRMDCGCTDASNSGEVESLKNCDGIL